jgi:Fic family protein
VLTAAQQSKSDPSLNGALSPVTSEKSHKTVSTNTTPDSSGSRAGLFRTTISGGVQSATFAHGLPPPALAVRNLMEQVASVI